MKSETVETRPNKFRKGQFSSVCVCVPDWDEKRQYSCEVFVCPRVAEEEQVRTSFGRDSIVVLVSVPVWAEEKQCIDVAETFPPEKC